MRILVKIRQFSRPAQPCSSAAPQADQVVRIQLGSGHGMLVGGALAGDDHRVVLSSRAPLSGCVVRVSTVTDGDAGLLAAALAGGPVGTGCGRVSSEQRAYLLECVLHGLPGECLVAAAALGGVDPGALGEEAVGALLAVFERAPGPLQPLLPEAAQVYREDRVLSWLSCALGANRHARVTLIRRALSHGSDARRDDAVHAAAMTIRHWRSAAATLLEGVVTALGESGTERQTTAASILAALGPEAGQTADRFAGLLGGTDDALAACAQWALARMGDRRCVEPLIRRAETESADPRPGASYFADGASYWMYRPQPPSVGEVLGELGRSYPHLHAVAWGALSVGAREIWLPAAGVLPWTPQAQFPPARDSGIPAEDLPALVALIEPLEAGRATPGMIPAIRALARFGPAARRALPYLRGVIEADTRPTGLHGGWRTITEDQELRAAALFAVAAINCP